jgi:hypothetical protein
MKGRRYSIGAAIADFYVLGIVSGAGAAVYVAAVRRPVPIWEPLLSLVLSLVLIAIYYAGFARKAPFLTPGEMMMGRVIEGGVKEWRNPYAISRTSLFVVLFAALVGAGNSWDSIANERFYSTLTFPVVFGRGLLLGGLLVALIRVGRGHAEAGFLIAAYFGITAIAGFFSTPPEGVSASVPRSAAALGLLLATLTAVLTLRYVRARRMPELGKTELLRA